jgi:hypothetical protein
MGDHTTGYVKQALDWCKSEDHTRRLLKAERHALNMHRGSIKKSERKLKQSLATINAVKALIYQQGWSE